MLGCPRQDCGWHAVAPSAAVAREQLAEHVVAEHASEIDAAVPAGMIQVRFGDDEEWLAVTSEEARLRHERTRDGDEE